MIFCSQLYKVTDKLQYKSQGYDPIPHLAILFLRAVIASWELSPMKAVASSFNWTTMCTLVQPGGRIIVSGLFTSYNGIAVNGILRLNENGSVDNIFVYGSGLPGYTKKF